MGILLVRCKKSYTKGYFFVKVFRGLYIIFLLISPLACIKIFDASGEKRVFYQLAYNGDALIFNSVAFWTGSNPMEKVEIRLEGGKKAVQSFHEMQDKKEMQILFYDKEILQQTLTLSQTRGSNLFSGHMVWAGGRSEDFSVQAAAEGLQVTRMDSTGQLTRQLYSGDSLDRISHKVARIMENRQIAALSQE